MIISVKLIGSICFSSLALKTQRFLPTEFEINENCGEVETEMVKSLKMSLKFPCPRSQHHQFVVWFLSQFSRNIRIFFSAVDSYIMRLIMPQALKS